MGTKNKLPLNELRIRDLFCGEAATYQIPIYQRNYAWERDEIRTLIQDVYDTFSKQRQALYYIGTLVTFHRGDNVYEVIDGQQRLTTIRIILRVLKQPTHSRLTYKARKRSEETLMALRKMDGGVKFDQEQRDEGIINGYKYAEDAIKEIVVDNEQEEFIEFFMDHVHIIHYQVPKDVDLNHYFEVMNSRGEQLEMHEIVKSQLMSKLNEENQNKYDLSTFSRIWEACSEMSVFVQQKFRDTEASEIFGINREELNCGSFDDIKKAIFPHEDGVDAKNGDSLLSGRIFPTLLDLTKNRPKDIDDKKDKNKSDRFRPIIDFPNFLLIVLKITRMSDSSFDPLVFNLDDKELLNEFRKKDIDKLDVKVFAFNLLQARYLLDNYIVHLAKGEDDSEGDHNPWKLERWHKEGTDNYSPKNLADKKELQENLVNLLSMFEVSFTARQRKNYLFYCLYYLMHQNPIELEKYAEFLDSLARKFFLDVYMNGERNSINTPMPRSFDKAILSDKAVNQESMTSATRQMFNDIYGSGNEASVGIPLYIFNYLDYCIWKKYAEELRGKDIKEGNKKRQDFFNLLGCADFGLQIFDSFYFSRTRTTLEHYYPQAMADGKNGRLNQNQINCLGNYAMIGSEINSSGSDWNPKNKLSRYLDKHKVPLVSVASLKFMIMMKICDENDRQNRRESDKCWNYDDIQNHQEKMLGLLPLESDTGDDYDSDDTTWD